MSKQSQSKAIARPTINNTPMGDFHNPYNFVPALPRNHLPKFEAKKLNRELISELGDGSPVGHGGYYDGYWSGKISVTLTTKTPLLIPDAANLTEKDGHKIYDIRMVNGKPYLPPTSVKGMLRSAYEAVTNSRLSIFAKHEDRLAYRMPANIGLQMVPARIENGKIYLYSGTSSIGNDGKPQGEMYAAWLPTYNRHNDQPSSFAIKYQGDQLPQHGQEVTAWLEKYEKTDHQGNPIFTYWRVRDIAPVGQNIANQPQPGQAHGRHKPTGDSMIQVNGYVCITNKNINNKHDERLFFCHQRPSIEIELTPELQKKWKELITNYQEIHQNEISQGMQKPPALNSSRWSRHITGGYTERNLSNESLCYAHVQKKGAEYQVIDLYPVMISRGLYQVNPESLLPEHLKPANQIQEMSPADRVFGWVNQNGQGSHKGQLRINSVTCNSDNSIKHFDKEPFKNGLPLAILGEPKPQQSRFYVAKNCNGEPLPDGTKKADGYQEGQGLRGRKVYPHHNNLPDNYWKTDSGTIDVDDREYIQPDKTPNKQNRTIKAWVEPETKFTFDIEVINLSSVELGALLWILSLPEDCYHRLGGGKPLGFGSVQLQISDIDLRKGEQWRNFYTSLMPIPKPDQLGAKETVKLFEEAIKSAYGNPVSFISEFLQSVRGFSKPIHYPRLEEKPNPDGKSYEWFVANENDTRSENALKISLSKMTEDNGLPLTPRIPNKKVN